jgi:hypothetical protein
VEYYLLLIGWAVDAPRKMRCVDGRHLGGDFVQTLPLGKACVFSGVKLFVCFRCKKMKSYSIFEIEIIILSFSADFIVISYYLNEFYSLHP